MDRVQTVLGGKDSHELGRTLTHEHLTLTFDTFYVPPPKHLKPFLDKKIELRNAGILRQYPYSNTYNLTFNDEETMDPISEEMKFYRDCGGCTIAENSNHGLKRNISSMKRVSRESGVNLIAGTGYYVAATQSASELRLSKEEMYNVMLREMTIGCIECPDVRTGFIGEVGSTWPFEDFENRSILATGELQEQLKCPVTFHPGRHHEAPSEIMRLYQEAGGDARKAILSHLDRTLSLRVAQEGGLQGYNLDACRWLVTRNHAAIGRHRIDCLKVNMVLYQQELSLRVAQEGGLQGYNPDACRWLVTRSHAAIGRHRIDCLKVNMGTLLDEQKLLEFSDETNCYCQFDLFGVECSFYQLNPSVDMPSDAQRIDRVKLLRDDKKLDRVLLSHDIHTKHRLMSFGGHGFAHIYNNVLPRMLAKGFTQEEIDVLTINNPKTWLLR